MRLLLLAAALWAAAAWTPAVAPPRGWSAAPGDGGATLLSGPKGALPLAPLVSIRRYAKDGKEFADAAAYVKSQSEPGIVVLKGQKDPVAGKVKLKSGTFDRVTRWSLEFVPPSSLDSVEVQVREEHVVFPGKDGFTVAVCAAPEKGFEKHRKAFTQILERVKP